jgi:hypothetical protein
MPTRNMQICIWCGNRRAEVCLAKCQPEGRYRYLEPEPLPFWEGPPELPPFRDLMALPAAERLAILYLHAFYRQGGPAG